jgi:hypothetical protein
VLWAVNPILVFSVCFSQQILIGLPKHLFSVSMQFHKKESTDADFDAQPRRDDLYW